MRWVEFVVLVGPWALLGCAAAIVHPAGDYDAQPAPPRLAIDRRCDDEPAPAKERCALGGNAVQGQAAAVDMYHAQVTLRLEQSVSGCGHIPLSVTVRIPEGAPLQIPSKVECEEECMPTGPGGGTCWGVPLRDIVLTLEFPGPLPFYRADGTPAGGELSLAVVSGGGHLQQELVLRVPEGSPAPTPEPTPKPDLCEEFNRGQSQLTPDEHQRQFGCPPCPCSCQNGEIRCAPCAACRSFADPPRSKR